MVINDEIIASMRALRDDFPILKTTVQGKPLVYLDNAATAQKPQQVIDSLTYYYTHTNANVHRGVHALSSQATAAYEQARTQLQSFINAPSNREVVFVRSTTEAINLVAQCFGRCYVKAGDEIVVSNMEHHANIVPWQLLCDQTGAHLKVIPMNQAGELLVDAIDDLLTSKTKLVAIAHVSNALGTINPIKEIIAQVHEKGIPVLVDGAQAAPHMKIDVQDLDCDFYAISSHKMFGPTGIGVLYAKSKWLEAMPPYQGGGDMIKKVSFTETIYNDIPLKFEAGTPNIAGAIGMGVTAQYLQKVGLDNIAAYEHYLLEYANQQLAEVDGLRFIGTASTKAAVISFVLDDVHAHDVGTILDCDGIAVRSGHHCAMPVMDFYGVPATVRASFCFYNTLEEIDCLVAGLLRVREVFAR